eukprot:TRINITY_DN2639_c0_g1_i1.p1 TRINITY_DN2639_c0_g1~~TRINITY_DN2639_c0_g1_i1.p1  ORF type:complete len:349 (+),score=59.10 TRINITY_DN2639_c0_g1_i1:19-1065(+)
MHYSNFVVLIFIVCSFIVIDASLIGIWQNWGSDTLPFTITEIDTNTARPVGGVLYTNSTLQALFGGQSVYDRSNNIWYLQNFGSDNAMIIALKVNLPKIEFLFSVPIPYEEFVITLDDVKNRLIISGTIPHYSVAKRVEAGTSSFDTHLKNVIQGDLDFAVEVGYIDLVTKTYKTLTSLPTNHFFITIAGSASVLDTKSRLLMVSTLNAITTPAQFFIDTVNIDTGEVKSYLQKEFIVESMVKLNDGTIFSLLSNITNNNSYLGSGSVTEDGVVSYKHAWTANPNLAFVVNSISVLDVTGSSLFTIISNGVQPTACLVNVDIKSGQPTSVHYFQQNTQYTQPLFIQTL